MQRLLLLVAAFVAIWTAHGQAPAARAIHLTLAKEGNDKTTTRFSTDAHKIRAIWKGEHLKVGDKLHAVWIADDVGATAPKHTKITESDVTAYKPDDDGVFALGRPNDGWPPGKYRVEIYLNGQIINSQSFAVERGATIEVNQKPTEPAQTSAPPQLEPSPAVQPKQ